MADDAMPDTWEGETDDSYVPIQPAAGEWRLVDDPTNDDVYQEIEQYCTFRLSCMRYLDFCVPLMRPRESEREIYKTMEPVWNDIHDTIDEFPAKRHLLMRADNKVYYHTSYTIFSDTDNMSRSVMLAQLPDVVTKMTQNKDLLMWLISEVNRAQGEELYNSVIESFNTWLGLAKSNMIVPFRYMYGRETAGRGFTPRAKLD